MKYDIFHYFAKSNMLLVPMDSWGFIWRFIIRTTRVSLIKSQPAKLYNISPVKHNFKFWEYQNVSQASLHRYSHRGINMILSFCYGTLCIAAYIIEQFINFMLQFMVTLFKIDFAC